MLLKTLAESRGEMSSHTILFTVDRGYGRQNNIEAVSAAGFNSLLITTDPLITSHP